MTFGRSKRLLFFAPALMLCNNACTGPDPPRDTGNFAKSVSAVRSPEPQNDSSTPTRDVAKLDQKPSAMTGQPKSGTLVNKLLFMPSKYPEGNWQPANLDYEDVWITSTDGTEIHGWYCPVDAPRAVVLYAHGNAGNLSGRAGTLRKLQSLGLSVLLFDYRGYGRSKGSPALPAVLEDAAAARTRLSELSGVRESEMVLLGRSLGGAVVIQLAAATAPKALIVQSSFSSLSDIASHHYPWLAWMVPQGSLDSGAAIEQCRCPLLQSHGDSDSVIPLQSAEKLFRAANQPKLFVTEPQAGHNDALSDHYYQQLDEFIDSLAAPD